MNRPRRYPLLGVPGGPKAPRTDEEKAAFDAGIDGDSNPNPSCPRTTELWRWGAETADELARESAMMRGYGR